MKKIYIKKILLIFFLSLPFNIIKASPQLPDYIIYKKDTIGTYNLLVEMYLQKLNPDDDKLFGLSFRNSLNGLGASLNCWRGYQAIYVIENDSLFVDAIIECYSIKHIDFEKSKENLKLLFEDKVKNNRVFIDWFTGGISFPFQNKNNEVIRWDGVFENVFLYETLIEIKKGMIRNEKEIINYIDDPQRINRKRGDTISNFLFEKIKDYKWKKTDQYDCSEEFEVRINRKGKIDQIKILNYTEEEMNDPDFFEKGECNHCIKSIKKALKDLKFDIVKRKGIPIEEFYRIEIWFNKDGTIENWTD